MSAAALWVGSLVATAALLLVRAPQSVAGRHGPDALAWRNRLASLSLVSAFVVATHAWISDPSRRDMLQYMVVTTIGYGHLLGGWVFARRRIDALRPAGVSHGLFAALIGVSVLTLLVGYAEAVARAPILLAPVLAVSTWHTIENDLALGRAYRRRLTLSPMPRDLDHHLVSIGIAGLVMAATLATIPAGAVSFMLAGTPLDETGSVPARILVAACGIGLALWGSRAPYRLLGAALSIAAVALPTDLRPLGIGFGEIFTITVLHHLIGWLIFFADRARDPRSVAGARERRALVGRLALVHLPFVAIALALLLPSVPALAAVRKAFFSPALYLFWSLLHVVQTLAVRGIEARGSNRVPVPPSLWGDT